MLTALSFFCASYQAQEMANRKLAASNRGRSSSKRALSDEALPDVKD